MSYILNLLLYGGVGKAEYDNVQPEINASNRAALRVFSVIALAFLAVMVFVSFGSDNITPLRYFYIGAACAMLLPLVYAVNLYKKYPKLLYLAIYLFMAILYAFGIVIGVVTASDQLTVSFIAFLLTIPLCFTDRPVHIISMTLFASAAFLVVDLLFKTGYTREIDAINVFVFGLVSCFVCTYMMMVKVRRFVYEGRTKMLSETDILTGLKNRNCFEERVADYPHQCSRSLTVVYIDVNGLHEMNDTQGHQAGDRMLQMVAGQVQFYFGKENSYRVGGDEFVAVAVDEPCDMTGQTVQKINRAVEEAGYHIAAGYHCMNAGEIDFDTLLKTAETRMYDAKKEYYSDGKHNRRKR